MRKAKRSTIVDDGSQALIVSVAGERLGIAADNVAEVIRRPNVTRLPLSPAGLLGVANLRGTVIPIVSLAVLLGRDEADDFSPRVVIVGNGQPIGITVEGVATLERSDRLGSGPDPVRLIDVDALITRHFGAQSKTSTPTAAGLKQVEDEEPTNAVDAHAFLSFEIARQEFALPLETVHEVLRLPDTVAVVPRTDDAMLGAIALRNRLLPLVSLGALLGLGTTIGSAAKIVVASIGGVRVGLVVDGLKAIVRTTADTIDPVPLVLTRGRQEAQIQGICRLDGSRRLISILSTDRLLDEGLAEQLAAQCSNEDERMADVASNKGGVQIVVFQLGTEHYGLPVDSVVEVVARPDKLTKLPKAPAFIEGMMNLRGQVVPVIDQRRRFEAAVGGGSKARILVMRIRDGLVGFVVDSVSEVLRVSEDQLRRAPELSSEQSAVIDRIANLEMDGRMILLVDPQHLLDRAEQDMIAAIHGTVSAPS